MMELFLFYPQKCISKLITLNLFFVAKNMIVHFQGIKRTYKYYQSNGKSGNVLGIYQTSHLLGVQVKQVPNRDYVPNLTLSVGFGSKS